MACQYCDNNCDSAQTFCVLAGQTVAENGLGYIDTELTQPEPNDFIVEDIWNNIITKLNSIYSYGLYGTRNPATAPDLIYAEDKGIITLELYNQLVDAIDRTQDRKERYDIIYANLFSTLRNNINAYVLNSNRCNVCNTGCNSCNTCQSDCCTTCYNCCTTCYNCCTTCYTCCNTCYMCSANANGCQATQG